MEVYFFLTSSGGSIISRSNIYFMCRELFQRSWSVSVSHIYREANSVVDDLASIGLKLSCNYYKFPCPPGEILHLLEDDRLGVVTPRVVSM